MKMCFKLKEKVYLIFINFLHKPVEIVVKIIRIHYMNGVRAELVKNSNFVCIQFLD